MLQKDRNNFKVWLESAGLRDDKYLKIVNEMKDEELEFFYNTFMTLIKMTNEKFTNFVKKYKGIE